MHDPTAAPPDRETSRAMIRPPATPEFLLDRNEAVPRLVGRHEDFLIVAGLAGTARDLTF